MNYQMPVKAIKSILMKEHESFIQSIVNRVYPLDYDRFIISTADEAIRSRIQSCETYEELDNFIGDSRHMSLEEWIDSL